MPIPDLQSLMLPALKALSDGAETSLAEIRARTAVTEGLTPEDLREMLPSGRQPAFANEVRWALFHMEKAGLVTRVRRGVYLLTAEGEHLLARAPARIDKSVLGKYPAYAAWLKRVKRTSAPSARRDALPKQPDSPTDMPATPEETLSRVADELRAMLEAEILDRVRNAEPEFFERTIVDLLIAMGYGGGDAAMGRVTGRSGDGGIDGTIREDTLGLDEVYVQAKKYGEGNKVSASDLRNFAGAIDAAGTTKGVFVTTAGFTRSAKDFVEKSPKRIVLIDGEDLARLMFQHGIGVRTRVRHEIKRIDEDYFDQEAL